MSELPYDQIGYWSEIKLDIIRDYASEYSKILSLQKSISRHVYVDAFAGWGTHISKKTGRTIPGSPANALDIEPPFSEYHFIDLDDQRVERLQEISANSAEVKVHHGDCNKILISSVFPRCKYEDYARALCLLDPYRLNVNWSILETAGQMKSIEVFFNFMIVDANRNVLWKNPDKVRPSQIEKMNAAWGDDTWREAAYEKQKGLFGEIETKRTNDKIATAFRERLREVAGFNFVPEPIPMKNKTGAIIYYLFFASQNKIGDKIVTHIFDKYQSR